MTKPARTAENRIPEPVIDSQLKLKTAPSGVGLATTGGTRWIMLWRPSTGKRKMEKLSSHAFTEGRPQRKTMTLKMSQGTQARIANSRGGAGWAPAAANSTVLRSERSRVVLSQISFGCQILRKPTRQAIETT